jgi:DNA (cytosine-5)-methyltransferase 1
MKRIIGELVPYKVIDLFCGAGGMTLGFTSRKFGGGFESVLGVDFDKAASATHARMFTGETVCGNIEDWLGKSHVPKADVVVGGPPCQGFSLLNKKREGDARRALWEPFLDVVALSGAKMFVMENVAELLRSQEYEEIIARADEIGFSAVGAILNAADFGAPQSRKRTIIIGWHRKRVSVPPKLPTPTHLSPKEAKLLGGRPWRTVRDAIGDLPINAIGTEIGPYSDPSEYKLALHFGRNPTALSVKRYKIVPEGGNRFDLQKRAPHLTPDCWIRKKTGGTDLFGRLWWDRPSVTIRTEFFKPEKGRYLHPVAHRPITHREAARLMGFPDDFIFDGSKVEIARQIGNAVPPALAGAISKVIKAALDGSPKKRRKKIAAAV